MANEDEGTVLTEENFKNLNLEQRTKVVDKRLNYPVGRIRTLQDLIALQGEEIIFVLSPIGQVEGGLVSNCIFFTWRVGSIEDHRGNVISADTEISIDNNEKYLCYHYDEDRKNQVVSCKDMNIIPNTYNNHAAFALTEDSKAYELYRKICFEEDTNLTALNEHQFPFWLERDEIKEICRIEAEYEREQQKTKKKTEDQ